MSIICRTALRFLSFIDRNERRFSTFHFCVIHSLNFAFFLFHSQTQIKPVIGLGLRNMSALAARNKLFEAENDKENVRPFGFLHLQQHPSVGGVCNMTCGGFLSNIFLAPYSR